ncbi:hypothetical protein [Pseudohaliea sp.]|uniref:hypothetical protein n=1 Tax=Pseudohaliea sp. TaxID=2740289 RepID=UPI0032F05A9C
MKALITATLAMLLSASALAAPAERVGRVDKRLTVLEQRGAWEQGSTADRREDRFDRLEDRVDRREDRRDRLVDRGPRDRAEDRLDRRENYRDRAENRRDRRSSASSR